MPERPKPIICAPPCVNAFDGLGCLAGCDALTAMLAALRRKRRRG